MGRTTLELPVWSGPRKRMLDEILSAVPSGVVWRMTWFDGVVPADSWHPPMDVPLDLAMKDADLRRFAATLEDLNEVRLVGVYQGATFELACHDSTSWTVDCDGASVDRVLGWFAGFG